MGFGAKNYYTDHQTTNRSQLFILIKRTFFRRKHFFFKNIVYTNIQAQIGPKIKNILRISSASVLAIVFFSFPKIFLINRILLI